MNITKFGHSCILLDDGSSKILFDPGSYSEIPDIKVDGIIITHVHQDHLDPEKIKALLATSPEARVITNTESVGELTKHNITAEIVEQGSTVEIGSFKLDAFGNDHATIHPTIPIAQNTGYIVNDEIFHPGDALLVPPRPMKLLFVPIVAPWSKVSETLDYIAEAKAEAYFPIHDAILSQPGLYHRFGKTWAENMGAKFIEPELGKAYAL